MRVLLKHVQQWSRHPHAVWYLGCVSFIEAIIFPIPPDVMLVPMMLTQSTRMWRLVMLTVLSSVFGAVIGYVIGFTCSQFVSDSMLSFGWQHHFSDAQNWFAAWGAWAVIIAGITPIPFKVFTLTAGVLKMPFFTFCLAACLGRSVRFGAEAVLISLFHVLDPAQIKQVMIKWGWGIILLFVLVLIYAHYFNV